MKKFSFLSITICMVLFLALVGVSGANAYSDMGPIENNTNRSGNNYMSFKDFPSDPFLCRDRCAEDKQCAAWTYVKPGEHGPKAECWLKSPAPEPAYHKCCISGVKEYGGKRCLRIILGVPNAACDKIGTLFNNGKGDKRRKKIGGNSLRINLATLRKYNRYNDQMKGHVKNWSEGFLRTYKKSGNIKYVALHVRNRNGKWKLIYKGKNLGFQLKSFEKYWLNSTYTDIIISLNGAHERFEPVEAKADIFICTSDRESILLGLPPCYK